MKREAMPGVNRHEFGVLISQIQSGSAAFIGRHSRRCAVFAVRLADKRTAHVLYDKIGKTIVAFGHPYSDALSQLEAYGRVTR